MASESLEPVDSTESLQEIYDEARSLFTERYGAPTLNDLLMTSGYVGSENLNNQILSLKYYDEAYCENLYDENGQPLQPIIPDPTAAYAKSQRSYEQTSSEFAATYGDMKEAELLNASGVDATDYESREQVLRNYADANPVSSDDGSDTNADADADDDTYITLGAFNFGNLNENLNLKYNDDYIFYDPNETSNACRDLIASKNDFTNQFSSILDKDTAFYDSLEYPYNKFIIDRRASVVLGNISNEIEAEFGITRDTINNVIGAILAYSDGDPTGLDELLAPKKSPSGGGGGGGFGDGGGGLPQPSEDSGGSGNAGDNSSSEEDLSDDEEMVIPTAGGQTGVAGGSAMSSLLDSSDELLELGDDNSIPSNTLLSDSAADSKFLIPPLSSNSMIGGNSDIKKSGIAISGAIVAAASMAIGGKIAYDKKKTDSNDEEENIDSNVINSNSDLNDDEDIKAKDATDDKKNEEDNKVFGKSTVGFKASLFDESESDIDE